MKIADSGISMASTHEYEAHAFERKASVEVKAANGAAAREGIAAIYEASGGSMVSALGAYQKQEAQIERQQRQEREAAGVRQISAALGPPPQYAPEFRPDGSYQMSLLQKMLELLNGKGKHEPFRFEALKKGPVLDLRGPASRAAGMRSQLFIANAPGVPENGLSVGTTAAGTVWQRVTAASGTYIEREYTTFQSRGFAVTGDGRSLSFDVEFSMARSFSEKFESLTSQDFIMTDPLVINLDGNVASVSDVKFKFDLDGDGQTEDISFAGEGSGFLALDVNGNGVIDDGSELFGTKSGDGFADLAAYDEDGNHWIDENDPVYSRLRVWTRDADGNDKLMDLKEANIGAIYLGSVSTEFSLNDAATNETNAVIRKTGVYLKETGEVGTLSHVDLRC